MPDRVRHDEGGCDGRWSKALARYARAEAGLEAVAHCEDDEVYDRALGRHNAALARLLRAPAPELGAVAEKLELILRHSVFELSFGEAALTALQRDVRGFALASLRASAPPHESFFPAPRPFHLLVLSVRVMFLFGKTWAESGGGAEWD